MYRSQASASSSSLTVGTVNQIDLDGVDVHPFHIHINPFQLTADPTDTADDYFRAGDWHDVMLSLDQTMSIRLQTDTFTGKQVFHCHILEHGELGMMVEMDVTDGESGSAFGAP